MRAMTLVTLDDDTRFTAGGATRQLDERVTGHFEVWTAKSSVSFMTEDPEQLRAISEAAMNAANELEALKEVRLAYVH